MCVSVLIRVSVRLKKSYQVAHHKTTRTTNKAIMSVTMALMYAELAQQSAELTLITETKTLPLRLTVMARNESTFGL